MSNTPELYSEPAERGILGACLTGGNIPALVMARLQPDDFYFLRHAYIYEAICSLERHGVEVDPVTVPERLKQMGRLDDIADGQYDGIQVISNLLAGVYRLDDVETWCDIVRYHALRRRVAEAGDSLQRLALKGEAGSHDLIAAIDKTAIDLRSGLPGERETFSEWLDKYLDDFEDYLDNPNKLRGVPSGISKIDKVLGGFKPATVNIIAGRPGHGKTAWMLNAMLAAARNGLHAGAINMEMDKEPITERYLSNLASINIHRISNKILTPQEYSAFLAAASTLQEKLSPYLHGSYDGYVTPSRIRSQAIQWQLEHGLDILFIDYLQLMESDNRHDTENAALTEISRRLMHLAKELKIPIVLLSQLNRAVEQRADKRPLLSDLRGSGSIEQDAWTVSFLYRHSQYDDTADRHAAEFIIAKNRQGPTGTVPLHFDGQYMRFSDGELRRVELGA